MSKQPEQPKKPICDRKFIGSWTAKLFNGVPCCPTCGNPASEHMRRQALNERSE